MKFYSLLLAIFIGNGCAAKKIVVSNADILLENQIEKRLPLYSSQKKELSKDVDAFLNEQKQFAKEAVPAITEIELDASKVDVQYDHLSEIYKKLALNFSKLMSKFMAELDEKQQKDFVRILKEENHTISGQKKKALNKVQERFETLFGSISTDQVKLFTEEKAHLIQRQELRVKRRELLHQRFAEIYKMDLSAEARAQYFYEAFEEYQNNYPDSPKNKEIIKKIIPTLSLAQKEVFEEKTKEIKEILNYYLETHY